MLFLTRLRGIRTHIVMNTQTQQLCKPCKALCTFLGPKVLTTAAYRLNSNDQTEKLMKTIITIVCHYMADQQGQFIMPVAALACAIMAIATLHESDAIKHDSSKTYTWSDAIWRPNGSTDWHCSKSTFTCIPRTMDTLHCINVSRKLHRSKTAQKEGQMR